MSLKVTLSSAALALCGALALSACQSSSTPAASGPAKASDSAPSSAAPASDSAPSSGATGSKGAASSAPAHSGSSATSGAKSGGGKTTGAATGSHLKDDEYAWSHLCPQGQLTVQVTKDSSAASRRVIAIHNNGSTACGVSYFPQIDIGNSKSADRSKNILPLIPGGLGGAPSFPVYANTTVYAVLDLNPSGATSGTATGVDEINVLATDNWPNAATQNFPLDGSLVLKPKLGLYQPSVADAISSMKMADSAQQ